MMTDNQSGGSLASQLCSWREVVVVVDTMALVCVFVFVINNGHRI